MTLVSFSFTFRFPFRTLHSLAQKIHYFKYGSKIHNNYQYFVASPPWSSPIVAKCNSFPFWMHSIRTLHTMWLNFATVTRNQSCTRDHPYLRQAGQNSVRGRGACFFFVKNSWQFCCSPFSLPLYHFSATQILNMKNKWFLFLRFFRVWFVCLKIKFCSFCLLSLCSILKWDLKISIIVAVRLSIFESFQLFKSFIYI